MIREDLPLGDLAAQLVHAAGESVLEPVPAGTFAIVLAAKDETQLLDIEARLCHFQIPHVLIREPDPPWNGAAMSIGIRPLPKVAVKRVVSSLPLLKEKKDV